MGVSDLALETLQSFIHSTEPGTIKRVFLAGGEPLLWGGTLEVVRALKGVGSEVVICTNGLPLRDGPVAEQLVADLSIDAVSISLDSYDASYNDHVRVDRSGVGWQGVVDGIRRIIAFRNACQSRAQIGVYTVVTRLNLNHLLETARFVAGLGVDYFVFQPVSLPKGHRLHDALSLDAGHVSIFGREIELLRRDGLRLHLPNQEYTNRVLLSIAQDAFPAVLRCFGGRELFFIEPDGSVWDCPSFYKIASVRAADRLSIAGRSAGEIFSEERRGRNTDCALFSQDCVNMWQLMAFDEIIRGAAP